MVTGVVVSDASGTVGVRRAIVTLRDQGRGTNTATVTDDGGKFTFANLQDGRYLLSAAKAGYVSSNFGARSPTHAGMPIVLASGERRVDLRIRMPAGGVITGQVRDERGEPSPRHSITVAKYQTVKGIKTLAPVAATSGVTGSSGAATDDRGVYRIYGLEAGEYVVICDYTQGATQTLRRWTTAADVQRALALLAAPGTASPSRSLTPPIAEQPALAYAPVYYPGTVFPSAAVPVRVSAGEERAGIDLQLQPMPLGKVEGRVTGVNGASASNAVVHLFSTETPAASRPSSSMQLGPDGTFRIAGIGPGRYAVEALLSVPATDPTARASKTQKTMWGTADVLVNGADAVTLSVDVRPTAVINGQLRFLTLRSGVAPGGPTPVATVNLTPEQLVPGSWVQSRAVTTTGGRFTIDGVPPGRYRLSASVPSSGSGSEWDFVGAVVASKDASDAAVDIGAGDILESTLTFDDTNTELVGRLLDPGGALTSDYYVVVFAADPKDWYWLSRRIQAVHVASDATFRVSQLPPGAYRLAAVTDVEQDEWFDPSFLEQLVPYSLRVDLVDGERTTQSIGIARYDAK